MKKTLQGPELSPKQRTSCGDDSKRKSAKKLGRSRVSSSLTLLFLSAICMTDKAAAVSGKLSNSNIQEWSVLNVMPSSLTVSDATNLSWVLTSNIPIVAGDCLTLKMTSPYQGISQTAYTSFNRKVPPVCKMQSGHTVTCDVVDAQTMRMNFTASSKEMKIIGATTNSPFTNPFSSRQISSCQVILLDQCDPKKAPKVSGEMTLTSFSSARIDAETVKFTSDSVKMGDTANLTVNFKPKTFLPKRGSITLVVPPWYTVSMVAHAQNDYSDQSMLGLDTKVKFVSHEPLGFKITDVQYQSTSRSLTISFEGPGQTNANATIVFSNFKNPVNKSPKSGFYLSTQDELGYVIDKSAENLPFSTAMVTPETLNFKQLYLLGDVNGNNIGKVGEYNRVEVQLQSPIPLEANCFFHFKFPKNLLIDQQLSLVLGKGMFQPNSIDFNLDTTLYSVNIATNSIRVQGCQVPKSLTTSPFGSVEFYFIKLPDFITGTDPIEVDGYSSAAMDQNSIIISDPTGVPIDASQMKPGGFEQISFTPSNFFAFATTVKYSLEVRPQHDLFPDSRIVINMPPTLQFNQQEGCIIEVTIADCKLDATTNTLTLTNIFQSRFVGGQILKFRISYATNPQGARPAGPWSIRSENNFNGTYQIVDGQTSQESFYAKPGNIWSNITINSLLTYDNLTQYRLQMSTQHAIPKNGFLNMTLPEECNFTPTAILEAVDTASFVNMTDKWVLFKFAQGHQIASNPIWVRITGVRNPRSFKPSVGFYIASMDFMAYVIDAGGQDINVVNNVMNKFTDFQVEAQNKTNGAVTTYTVKFNSSLPAENADILYLDLPLEAQFQDSLYCTVTNPLIGIKKVDCSNVGNSLIANLNSLSYKFGAFNFEVHGIKNPPSFRPSSPYSNILHKTSDFFPIQTIYDYSPFFIQNEVVSRIWTVSINQELETYGSLTNLKLNFYTNNQMSSDGVLTLKWDPKQLTVFPNTTCSLTTYKKFDSSYCTWDLSKSELNIYNAFSQLPSYQGAIQLELDKVQIPKTNKNLSNLTLTTYDDANKQFPIDMLDVEPALQCNSPCMTCAGGDRKTDCLSCRLNDFDFSRLQQKGTYSTCQRECDAGWTTNGTADLKCSRCDPMCETCRDKGFANDQQWCLSCAEGYNLKIKETPQLCFNQCPDGMFDAGNGFCEKCSSDCFRCQGTPTTCTACQFKGALPNLLGNTCVDVCPPDYTEKGGVCTLCESPCSTCKISPNFCTSCEPKLLLFGPTCVDECPNGTKRSVRDGVEVCEGCLSGCTRCDVADPRVCNICNSGLMVHEGDCVNDCPPGFLANFKKTECLSQDTMDARLIYFPFIACMIVALALNLVGGRIKLKHRKITNFLICIGLIEHGALITQVVLCFFYATVNYSGCCIVIYIVYFLTNPLFHIVFQKKVTANDKLYREWRTNPVNKWARMIIACSGIVFNWRCYKLLYSHFFGYQVKTSLFANPEMYVKLNKIWHVLNCVATYLPLIIFDIVGLADLDWGNQFYICLIETLVLSIVMLGVGIYELFQVEGYLAKDGSSKENLQRAMKVMSGFDDENDMTKDKLLKKQKFATAYIDRKLDELVKMFGKRRCKSEQVFGNQKERDPRQIYTWPMSPHIALPHVDNPPQPFPDDYPNNCYNQPKSPRWLKKNGKLGTNCFNKGIQCGGLENDVHRMDAGLISFGAKDFTTDRSTDKKKIRGRKNRYFQQIDNEDHDAGAALDSDEEGKIANEIAKREHIERMAQLEAIREEDEELEKRRQEREKRRLNARKREEELAAENQRLREILAKERAEDDRIASQFKQQLQDEEKRRRELLNSHKNDMAKLEKEKAANMKSKLEIDQKNERDQKKKKQERPLTPPAEDEDYESEYPPDASKRNFNEIDVLGDFGRDAKGNLQFELSEGQLYSVDRQGRKVTTNGYLVDAAGSIIDHKGRLMFAKADLDEQNQIPLPFGVERFNFNPFDLQGDLAWKKPTDPLSFTKSTKNGRLIDSKGRLINKAGFLVDSDGNILNRHGDIRFSAGQLAPYGGELPQMYIYSGKKFNLLEVMGVFDRDASGRIKLIKKKDKNGKDINVDKGGYQVNSKGYIVNSAGHICTRGGRKLFHREHLKNGEPPKFFPFTRFNAKRISGEFDYNPAGNAILTKSADGLKDKLGRLVNKKGYLVAANGDTTDQLGNVMFEANLLDTEGDIPELFRLQVLRSDSQSSLSRLMGELDEGKKDEKSQKSKSKPKAESRQQEQLAEVERKLRLNRTQIPDHIDEESDQLELDEMATHKKKRRRRQKPASTFIIEEVTDRDIRMASAYGGVAKPRLRKVKQRFNTVQRGRQGLMSSDQRSRPAENPKIGNLINSNSGYQLNETATAVDTSTLRSGPSRCRPVKPNTYGQTAQKPSQDDKQRKIKDRKQKMRARGDKYDQAFEDEFERLYKKDIDKFIDGSDFEVESLEGFSELSKNTFQSVIQNTRMKGLEKVYLQRLEFNKDPVQAKKTKKKQGYIEQPRREFMDRFIDDPQYLTRGEKLRMETQIEPERHSGRHSGAKGGSGFKDKHSQDSYSLIEAGYAISGATPFGMMPHQSTDSAYRVQGLSQAQLSHNTPARASPFRGAGVK